jgi:hypothetical protein
MMKKRTAGLWPWALVVLILISWAPLACQKQVQPDSEVSAVEDTECVPEWVLSPPSAEDGLYGTGLAKMQNPALTKKAADSRARDEVVLAIQAKVQTMMKDFMQETGLGEGGQSLQFAQSVSKAIGSNVMQGCKIVKRKVCPDGTWYSLALWPIGLSETLKKDIAEQTKKQAQKETALYNEFKATKAFEALDKEMDKLDDQLREP